MDIISGRRGQNPAVLRNIDKAQRILADHWLIEFQICEPFFAQTLIIRNIGPFAVNKRAIRMVAVIFSDFSEMPALCVVVVHDIGCTAAFASDRASVQSEQELQKRQCARKINISVCFVGEFIIRAGDDVGAVLHCSEKLLGCFAAFADPQVVVDFLV